MSNHAWQDNNTDNNNFIFNSQVNINNKKSNLNSEIYCNRNDIFRFNFAQNPDDDLSSSAKSNGTGLPADLSNCNIDTVNNLDDQIIQVWEEASKINNKDIS